MKNLVMVNYFHQSPIKCLDSTKGHFQFIQLAYCQYFFEFVFGV